MPDQSSPSVIVYGVGDLDAARSFYTAVLGTAPYADAPFYVGYRVGDVEIGLDPNAPGGNPIAYWGTDDIAGRVDALVAAGGTVQRPATDVGGGMLVAVVADGDGNLIGLRQA